MLKVWLLVISFILTTTATFAAKPEWIDEIYFKVDDSIYVVGHSKFHRRYSLAFGDAFHNASVQAALLKDVDIMVTYSEEILNGENPEMKEYSKLSSTINFRRSRLVNKYIEFNDKREYKVYILMEMR